MGYIYVPQGIIADFCRNMTNNGFDVEIVSFDLSVKGTYEVTIRKRPKDPHTVPMEEA